MILRFLAILDHFQWENNHNSLQQSWITIENATFGSSKKILGPVHLLTKTNKWDYLQCPIIEKKFVSCFDIGEVPRSPRKWNWNWLSFLPFSFSNNVFRNPIFSKKLVYSIFFRKQRKNSQRNIAKNTWQKWPIVLRTTKSKFLTI